jgi:hypothetical protein
LSEQAAPRAFRPELDPAEVAAANVRNAVVAREPLVHERVLGGQEIDDAAPAPEHAVDEQHRLALERRA